LGNYADSSRTHCRCIRHLLSSFCPKEEQNFELKALNVSTIEKSLKLRVDGINSTAAPELQAVVKYPSEIEYQIKLKYENGTWIGSLDLIEEGTYSINM